MIEMDDIPSKVLDALIPYKKNKSKIDQLGARLFYDDKYYYCFLLSPPVEYLVVREDGEIPAYDEVYKVNLISVAFSTSVGTLVDLGVQWSTSSTKKKYEKLIKTLSKVNETIKSKAPSDIQEALKKFLEVPNSIIKDQILIEEKVKAGVDFSDEVFKREVLTEEDQIILRQNIVDTTRAAHRQSMVQVEAESEIERVMDYLYTKIWTNPKLFQYFISLKGYQKKMLSSEDPESMEVKAMKDEIAVDEPLEEKEEMKDISNSLLNPRN